ncbi:MAG: LCP family protein [Lachnospiraceae bacterium]|nr:LCP family protein [Lachnospiraceae bacterium]
MRDYEEYDDEPVRRKKHKKSTGTRTAAGKRRSKKKRAAKRRNRTILFILEIALLVVLLFVLWGFMKPLDAIQKITIDEDDIVMNEKVKEDVTMKGYRNIALFGVDSRSGDLLKGTRSDTIIIASINQDTGDVKLVSVFRDTYLNLGNDTYNKCNAAYAKGGPEQAIAMLNKNLDLNITEFMTVGFKGLIEVVDAIGGVEIDVTEAEIPHLNNYQISMVGKTTDGVTFTANEGTDYIAVRHSGKQVLNGLQATAYCRIRYVGNDFMRAQRQRTVIQAVADKAKTLSASELTSVAEKILEGDKLAATNLQATEIYSVLGEIAKYNIVQDDGFPFEEYRGTGTVGSKGSCVIPKDLKKNVAKLHDFLFGEKDYQLSSEAEECSKKVSSDTGKYVNSSADEFASKKDGKDETKKSSDVKASNEKKAAAEIEASGLDAQQAAEMPVAAEAPVAVEALPAQTEPLLPE